MLRASQIMNKVTITIASLLIGLTSCTKDANGVDEITSTTSTVVEAINTLNITESGPSLSSRSNEVIITVDVNGSTYVAIDETPEAFADDDDSDSIYNIARFFASHDVVVGQTVNSSLNDATGEIIETTVDLVGTMQIQLQGAVDGNTNEFVLSTPTLEVRQYDNNANLINTTSFVLQAQFVNATDNSVSYNDNNGLSFTLSI